MSKTHTSDIKKQVLAGSLAILLNLVFPGFIEDIRYFVLAAVILVIGMPHGALDHLIAFRAFGVNREPGNVALFYSMYLGILILYGLMWFWFPLFSMILFLFMTLYHFGQADAERFDLPRAGIYVLQFSRGFTVVGLILFGADPFYSSAIIQEVTGYSFAAHLFPVVSPSLILVCLAALYPLAYLLVQLKYAKPVLGSWLSADAVVVPLLFALCDPVFAFSMYFGIWHSYNHTQTMLRFMRTPEKLKGFKWFYRETFLYSVLSYAGLIVLYVLFKAFGNEELLVALLFIIISVLTLPHMFVVEKMYKSMSR